MAKCKFCGKQESAMFCVCGDCMSQIQVQCAPSETNLDWIRSMDLSELADFILSAADGIPFCRGSEACESDLSQSKDIPIERCKSCLSQWLTEERDTRK